MAQLLLALKEHEIPQRGLYGQRVYEMVDKFVCKCGKQSVVSVVSTNGKPNPRGRRRPVGCLGCLDKARKTEHGWFKSYRFVPLNDPEFKGDDVPIDIPLEAG